MTALTIRLPASLHREIKQLAKAEGVSINQFITLAAAEKISALRTLEFLQNEAEKGSREDYDALLASVPDVEPMEEDRLDEAQS
jgi:hypothetical protein